MDKVEKALATQLTNIEQRTGKTLKELSIIVIDSGLLKHGEMVNMLKSTLGMGHGDANTLVHYVRQGMLAPTAVAKSLDQVLDGLYVGKKAALQPIHERLTKELNALGEFETAPKKAYISYRCKKQFCMIGPATNTQVEIGLNVKDLGEHTRLKSLPAGQMCNYKIRLAHADEVDAELMSWIKAAYISAQ